MLKCSPVFSHSELQAHQHQSTISMQPHPLSFISTNSISTTASPHPSKMPIPRPQTPADLEHLSIFQPRNTDQLDSKQLLAARERHISQFHQQEYFHQSQHGSQNQVSYFENQDHS